jgi:hypothetical protein
MASTPPRRTLAVQVPALFGNAIRRVEGTRFEREPGPISTPSLDRLLVYDAGECVALFLPGYWHAAWWLPPKPPAEAGAA